MKAKKIFSEEEALAIMGQIYNGFSELAKIGIVHRDLKSENIFLVEITDRKLEEIFQW